MAISTVTATSPAESAKSIQLTLDALYNNEAIKLQYSQTSGGTFTDVTQNYLISLVKDSSKVDVPATPAYYYSLIIGKFDYYESGGHSAAIQAQISQMLTPGYYKVTIGTISSAEIHVESTLATSAKFDTTIPVTAVGSSILQLRFTAPIRNLFVTHSDSNLNATILDNISYSYGTTTNETPFKINPDKFKGYLSNDGKVLTLESPEFNFENGKTITAYINDSTFQQFPRTTNTVLTNYDSTLSTIPVASDDDTAAVSVENSAATITSASGTRTKLNTTFTKPVLLASASDLTYNNILSVNGTPERAVQISSITRDNYNFVTGNNAAIKAEYTKLLLNIVPTSSNALPVGNSISLNVGALTSNTNGALIDASRLLVPKTAVSANITAETPKVVSAIQNMTPPNNNSTEIDITFSQAMNISPSTGATSALDPSNYKLKIGGTTQYSPISVSAIPQSNNTMFKIIFSGILTSTVGQSVTLEVNSTVTNAMGDAFSNVGTDNVATLTQLKDTTIPEVTAIIGLNKSPNNTGNTVTDEDNGLIIKFKTSMAITGNNSAILPTNYKFIESTAPVTNAPLNANSNAITGITPSNSWILFTLDPTSNYPVFQNTNIVTSGNPNLNYDIHIGYTGLTSADYKYVENTAGNIYPICNLKKISATVPLIDLSKGTVTILNNNTLVYTYTDKSIVNNVAYHNEFRKDTIIPTNFEIYELDEFNCSGTKTQLTINSVSLDATGTVLTFTLPANTLSSDTKYIYLSEKISTSPVVYDIFNKEVSGVFCNEVINNIPTALNSLNVIDISKIVSVDPSNPDIVGYPVEIAASFANSIAITSPEDFLIAYSTQGGGAVFQNVVISSASILQINGKNSNVVILKAYIPLINFDFIQNELFVRTSNITDPQYLRTKDLDNKSIEAFDYTIAESFNIDNAIFQFNTAGDLDGASLSASYNTDIVDSSIPPETLTPNGLLIQNVKFMQQTPGSNFYYIDISNTVPKLGYLILSVKSPTDPIFASGDNNTAFNVTINKLNTDTLVFEFSKAAATTDLTLNMNNVIYMQYIPSKYNLMGIDANDNNIYANVSFEKNANTPII